MTLQSCLLFPDSADLAKRDEGFQESAAYNNSKKSIDITQWGLKCVFEFPDNIADLLAVYQFI